MPLHRMLDAMDRKITAGADATGRGLEATGQGLARVLDTAGRPIVEHVIDAGDMARSIGRGVRNSTSAQALGLMPEAAGKAVQAFDEAGKKVLTGAGNAFVGGLNALDRGLEAGAAGLRTHLTDAGQMVGDIGRGVANSTAVQAAKLVPQAVGRGAARLLNHGAVAGKALAEGIPVVTQAAGRGALQAGQALGHGAQQLGRGARSLLAVRHPGGPGLAGLAAAGALGLGGMALLEPRRERQW